MINLTSKYLLIFLVFIGEGCSANLNRDSNPLLCVEKALNAKIVRTDEKNKRYFLVDNNFSEDELTDNIVKLRQCFSSTNWSGNWSLSFFTDKKYAGYKDEDTIIKYHSGNRWAKSYQFEYSEKDQQLISFPALNPKAINIK